MANSVSHNSMASLKRTSISRHHRTVGGGVRPVLEKPKLKQHFFAGLDPLGVRGFQHFWFLWLLVAGSWLIDPYSWSLILAPNYCLISPGY